MDRKSSMQTSTEWWDNFPRKFVSTDILLSLATPIAAQHTRLSLNHVYHLVAQVVRYMYFEFASYRCRKESGQLEFIHILEQIVDEGAIFDYKCCGSSNIENLSRFNAGDENTIEWLLSNAIGPSANKLSKPRNISSYGVIAKELTKEASIFLLRNFYNFLVTRPVLSETQHVMVIDLSSILARWVNQPVRQVSFPIQGTSIDVKKVNFNLGLVETPIDLNSTGKENLPPPPLHTAKPKQSTWFRKIFY